MHLALPNPLIAQRRETQGRREIERRRGGNKGKKEKKKERRKEKGKERRKGEEENGRPSRAGRRPRPAAHRAAQTRARKGASLVKNRDLEF